MRNICNFCYAVNDFGCVLNEAGKKRLQYFVNICWHIFVRHPTPDIIGRNGARTLCSMAIPIAV